MGGMSIQGADAQFLIGQNEIRFNNNYGIQIGIGNKSQIINNEIMQNKCGIEIISAEPYIQGNVIEKNLTNGILASTYDNVRCDGKIVSNVSISQNRENGIMCIGNNNYIQILENNDISYNKKAGLKISEYAHVFVEKNIISKNLGQGILIQETSSGIIENNVIQENIKANIALGGQNSQNSLIINNKIIGGRCEGIFMINACECFIIRNCIEKNNDGIIMITSVPLVQNNIIVYNKNHGIMLMKDSRPQIIQNNIGDNGNVGLYIRDKSCGNIDKNQVQYNSIDLVQEKKHIFLYDLLGNNVIIGEKRIPSNYQCNIF
ncbi:Pectin lyase fold/virulence factor [Pseudocohnilembus persalinus]|uniref:Pectin lyase fold/virulence factor n=1 Tax=Pseudocohnilembus persalinus TaxID=266149 RepID=A0A0V0QVZ2_PSEPJ|nr:Pectin lyase fold/virulence factor [Pseudocohnilembus persalinus]|eukprot:KRX06053.1 Pectin lyase fold/virulence factor [Pseudocohnilembus persalinus]